MLPRIRLRDDEVLVGASPVGETLGVISDRALYFFDGRELAEHQREMTPRLRVPMPGAYRDIYNLGMIELVDGYLIVFSNSYDAHSAAGVLPYQQVLRGTRRRRGRDHRQAALELRLSRDLSLPLV